MRFESSADHPGTLRRTTRASSASWTSRSGEDSASRSRSDGSTLRCTRPSRTSCSSGDLFPATKRRECKAVPGLPAPSLPLSLSLPSPPSPTRRPTPLSEPAAFCRRGHPSPTLHQRFRASLPASPARRAVSPRYQSAAHLCAAPPTRRRGPELFYQSSIRFLHPHIPQISHAPPTPNTAAIQHQVCLALLFLCHGLRSNRPQLPARVRCCSCVH